MLITSFVQQLTGLDLPTLQGLVRFQDHLGSVTCTMWNVPNVPQPTQADIDAAMAAPEPVIKSALIAYAGTVQDTKASGGLTVNVDPSASTPKNVYASTSTKGLALLSGALQHAQLDPNTTIDWVGNDGITSLTAAEVTVLGQSVFAFVQGTFSQLAAVVQKINAGQITTEAEIDSAFA